MRLSHSRICTNSRMFVITGVQGGSVGRGRVAQVRHLWPSQQHPVQRNGHLPMIEDLQEHHAGSRCLVLSGYVIARDMILGRVHLVAVHSFDDCNDDRSTGTQRAVPLRLGPQVQTLLPREGQRGSERRTEGGGGSG